MLFLVAALVFLSQGEHATAVVSSAGTVYRTENTTLNRTVLLGALFPIHLNGQFQPCGAIRPSAVQLVESMVLAISMINDDPSLLPNVKLAFDIRDTCLSVNYALQQSLDYIQSINGFCSNENVLGASVVVGAFTSDISLAAANLYGLFELPQISYGSSATVLSDTSRFNYFYRTIPSDIYQAIALVDIVTIFGWRHIIALHSNDLYGSGGIMAFGEELSRRNTSACLANTPFPLDDNAESYAQAVDRMTEDWVSNASVVLLFGHMHNAVGVFKEIEKRLETNPQLRNLTWLAGDSWGDNLPGDYRYLARGMLSTVPQSQAIQAFDDYFTSLNLTNNEQNPWFNEYWENQFRCNLDMALGDTCDVENQTISTNTTNYSQFSLVPLVFDAVYVLAHSVQDLIDKHCPSGDLCTGILSNGVINGALLRDSILSVSFPSPSRNKTFSFNENGDVDGFYTVLNLQGLSNGQYGYTRVGSWDVNNFLTIDEGLIHWAEGGGVPESFCSAPCREGEEMRTIPKQPECCFTCEPCLGSFAIVNGTCRSCGDGRRPNTDHSACEYSPITFLRWSDPWGVVLTVLTTIGVVVTTAVIIVLLVYIKHEFIKASSRELSAILISGILLCFIVPYFYIAKPSAAICALRRFGLGFCFTVSYSALLVKTNRIHRIFNRSPNSLAKHVRFINPLSQVLITLGFISVQVVINIIWLSVQQPRTIMKRDGVTNELVCAAPPAITLPISLGYSLILLILSTYFAFLTRKVPANFNEAKFINVNVYSICIIWLAFIPVYFGTLSLGTVFQATTLCFGIILSTTTTLCCLFVSKIIILFSRIRKKKKAETVTAQVGSMNASTNAVHANSHINNHSGSASALNASINSAGVRSSSLSASMDVVARL